MTSDEWQMAKTKNLAFLPLGGFALNIRFVRALTLLLLLALFAQGMAHIRHASITFDEGPHLAIGYATLRTGDFRLQPVHIHPPLANALAGAPLLLQDDLPDPRTVDGWGINSLSAITDAVVWQYPHPRRIAVAGRAPILLLTVLLGALVYRWSRDLGGTRAGLFALALLAFDPNIIAHGTLVTTDMAAVFFIVATLYATKQQIDKTTKRQSDKTTKQQSEGGFWGWVGIGVLMGLAQLTKVSALMLVPVVGLLVVLEAGSWMLDAGRLTFDASRFALYVFRACALIFGAAAFVVWAGYGFEVGRVSGFPIPLPAATHIRIFQSLREHYDLGHATFAMGRVSSHGWWWYFPAAFVLKTPVPVLLSIAYCVLRIKHLTFDASRLTLFLFPALYAVSSLFSSVNIGYRHLLPVLPLLYVGIGVRGSRGYGVGSRKYGVRSKKEVALRDIHAFQSLLTPYSLFLISLIAWMIFSSLTIAPDYLAFFNLFAGGPGNGYRYLVDSNLDWGQNLWDLRAWMEAHGEEEVAYAHYSPARPATYGIDATLLPPSPRAGEFTPWAPAPGLYAIGATVLQGPYTDVNTYAWFRAREPEAKLGHALFVYRVAARPPADWAVLCAGVGFGPDRVQGALDQPDLRVLQPECAQAHVFPSGVGLVVTPPDLRPPEGVERDFVLRAADGSTTAVLYRVEGAPAPSHPTEESVRMDGPLTFLGYDLSAERIAPGETLELHTHWRVERVPGRPLSLLAHLIGPEGGAIAVGDGLGFPLEQWRTRDIIVQRHALAIPPDASSGIYALHTGGYWLDTMERWPVGADDKLVLATLRIEE